MRELKEQSAVVLDNESKERALVGEVISTVALAGQISREFNVSDHGIDMEIEFKDDAGKATGKKLYLQLKSGAQRFEMRVSDILYWTARPFPVMLLFRIADGEVRWIEVRDWINLKGGHNPVKQFEGERFDVMSVRRWRDRILGTTKS